MKLNWIGVCIGVLAVLVIAATVQPGLRIRQYPNDSNPPDDAAYILDETTVNKHILHSQLRFRLTNGLATITYVSNYVLSISTNAVTIAPGTGITVATNVTGTNTIYTVTCTVTTNGLATINYVDTHDLSVSNAVISYTDTAASNRVTVAAGANVTVTTNGSGGVETYTVAAQSAFAALEVQTNNVRVGLVTNIDFINATAVLSGSTAIVTNGSGTGGGLTGTTNFMNLSVQAVKLPTTNYPGIDAGWQDWETIFYKTNAEGSIADLNGSWQTIMPPDYATNSLSLLLNYSLLNTNGPNTSNVIFGVSCLVIRSGTTNNVHTNLFGAIVWGTNNWIAKYDGTNTVTNLVINLGTNSLLMAGDLMVLKLQRDAVNDTFGGTVAAHALQLIYTRP